MGKKFSALELQEFRLIQQWFSEARMKEDYNREILDIGVEIPIGDQVWTLLKGPQTGNCYELISPECKWFENLKDLSEVHALLDQLCRDSS